MEALRIAVKTYSLLDVLGEVDAGVFLLAPCQLSPDQLAAYAEQALLGIPFDPIKGIVTRFGVVQVLLGSDRLHAILAAFRGAEMPHKARLQRNVKIEVQTIEHCNSPQAQEYILRAWGYQEEKSVAW